MNSDGPMAELDTLRAFTAGGAAAQAAVNKILEETTAKCERCGCTWTRACAGGCAWNPAWWSRGRAVCTACTAKPLNHGLYFYAPAIIAGGYGCAICLRPIDARLGFARVSHGRKHVRDGHAVEQIGPGGNYRFEILVYQLPVLAEEP